MQSASPGYFQTVGIPLLRGRLIDDRDIADRESVAVISESMARQFFPEADPVGAKISTDDGQRWITIVGVVGDVRSTLASETSATFYRPLAQAPLLTVMFLVRTTGEPSVVMQQMRDAVHGIDPQQPVDRFRTLEQVRSDVARGAAPDGDPDRRVRADRARGHGDRPRRRDRVLGEPAGAGVRGAAWRSARRPRRCCRWCWGRACELVLIGLVLGGAAAALLAERDTRAAFRDRADRPHDVRRGGRAARGGGSRRLLPAGTARRVRRSADRLEEHLTVALSSSSWPSRPTG